MDQLAELRQDPHWWVVLVSYDRKRRNREQRWEPVALLKYEVEAAAYVDRHNSHGQAGMYRKISISSILEIAILASSMESSSKPDLPVVQAMLVGNSISTSDVSAPGV